MTHEQTAQTPQPVKTDAEIVAELIAGDPQNGQLLARRYKALRSWGMPMNEALSHWRMGVRL